MKAAGSMKWPMYSLMGSSVLNLGSPALGAAGFPGEQAVSSAAQAATAIKGFVLKWFKGQTPGPFVRWAGRRMACFLSEGLEGRRFVRTADPRGRATVRGGTL